MSAEVGRYEAGAAPTPESPHEFEETDLPGVIERVAGLHLDRRCPARGHPVEPTGGRVPELGGRGFPGHPHGGQDPSAPTGNLGVARSLDLPRKLERPLSGEDGMRMRINEPGEDGAAPRVDPAAPSGEADGARGAP